MSSHCPNPTLHYLIEVEEEEPVGDIGNSQLTLETCKTGKEACLNYVQNLTVLACPYHEIHGMMVVVANDT